MSESAAHKRLVLATAGLIARRYPSMSVQTDIQEAPGDEIPNLIGNHRPDIVARPPLPSMDIIIAEAKTAGDMNRRHTLSQVETFVNYLRSRRIGDSTFILAVSGAPTVSEARSLLRYTCRSYVSSRLDVQIFDGLDLWALGGPREDLWLLC